MVTSFCSLDVGFLIIKCRPFYLPREFTSVTITDVYLPSSANTKEAVSELYHSINMLQITQPDCIFVVAEDFNQANLRSELPNFHQYVDFAMRGMNTLDLVYTNISKAFKVVPHPHLGSSDHLAVMVIPPYKTLFIR